MEYVIDGVSVTIRPSTVADIHFAQAICDLIAQAAIKFDIATRDVPTLVSKLESGHAVVAVIQEVVIGFGYLSIWEDMKVSHSGLVVSPLYLGKGLGGALKNRLMKLTKRLYPTSDIISLTTNPAVLNMNQSLGFKEVPAGNLTCDNAFWKGCYGCRKFAELQKSAGGQLTPAGHHCCCIAMIRHPEVE